MLTSNINFKNFKIKKIKNIKNFIKNKIIFLQHTHYFIYL